MRLDGSALFFSATDAGQRDSWVTLLGTTGSERAGFGEFGKAWISGFGVGRSRPEGQGAAFDPEGPIARDGWS